MTAPPRPAEAAPFRTGAEAWFWAVQALAARRDGRPFVSSPSADPDAIVRCLDQLYRARKIELVHARILRIWGEHGTAPNPAYPRKLYDWRLWREAIDLLERKLRANGFVR